MKLKVGGRIRVRGEWWDFDKPVNEARLIKGRVVVVFDCMAWPRGRPSPNLSAFGIDRKLLWTAPNLNLSYGDVDSYVEILSEEPLRVYNFAGFVCTVDPETGEIIRQQFSK